MIETQNLLNKMYEVYPELARLGKLEYVYKVHMPLGLLDLKIEEATFEEFDTIEWLVLRLIKYGVKTPEDIAGLMGLSENYILKIFKILEGFEFIKDGEITEYGLQSANDKEQRKYLTNIIHQKVQIQPNFAVLMTELQRQLQTKQIHQLDEDYDILPADPVVEETLLNALKVDLTKFKIVDYSVLNANALSIQEILSKEVVYASGFIVKFEFETQPILCAEKRTVEQETKHIAPLAITQNMQQLLQWNDVEISHQEHFERLQQYINILRNNRTVNVHFPYYDADDELALTKYAKKINAIQDIIHSYLGLKADRIKWDTTNRITNAFIEIESLMETKINRWLHTLLYLNSEIKPLVKFGVKSRNGGQVVYLQSSDLLLCDLAKKLQQRFKYAQSIQKFYNRHANAIEQLKRQVDVIEYLIIKIDEEDQAISNYERQLYN